MDNGQIRLKPQDLQNATELACDKCGHKYFVPVFVIKHLSALVSPTGQEAHIPIQTFACADCGHVNATFAPEM